MNSPTIITKKDLLKFIEAQPDERHIKMSEFSDTFSCGCVMVHYGREVLKRKDFSCSSSCFYPDDSASSGHRLENLISRLLPVKLYERLTYGELKKRLATKTIDPKFPDYLGDSTSQSQTKQ